MGRGNRDWIGVYVCLSLSFCIFLDCHFVLFHQINGCCVLIYRREYEENMPRPNFYKYFYIRFRKCLLYRDSVLFHPYIYTIGFRYCFLSFFLLHAQNWAAFLIISADGHCFWALNSSRHTKTTTQSNFEFFFYCFFFFCSCFYFIEWNKSYFLHSSSQWIPFTVHGL